MIKTVFVFVIEYRKILANEVDCVVMISREEQPRGSRLFVMILR